MDEIQNELQLIANDIKTAVQEVIVSNGLVDTGLLRDTIDVKVGNDLNLEIFAQNYFIFLDEGTRRGIKAYNLTEQIEQHPLYISAVQKLEGIFTQYILKKLGLQ
jgi:hypothetical protein